MREDDHRDRDARGGEIARRDHPDRRPEERKTPEVGEALAKVRPRARLSLLLEASPHEEQGGGREYVRDRVGEKRQPAREAEERTAGGWGGEPHRRHAPHRQARGVSELRLRHDRLERAAGAGAEDDGGTRVDEADEQQQPERRVMGKH